MTRSRCGYLLTKHGLRHMDSLIEALSRHVLVAVIRSPTRPPARRIHAGASGSYSCVSLRPPAAFSFCVDTADFL